MFTFKYLSNSGALVNMTAKGAKRIQAVDGTEVNVIVCTVPGLPNPVNLSPERIKGRKVAREVEASDEDFNALMDSLGIEDSEASEPEETTEEPEDD